jgi:hypothetical protein
MRLTPERNDIAANRRQFDSPHGDPFTLLNMYQEWLKIKAEKVTNSRKWCHRHGIEEQRLYEMTKLVDQFRSTMGQNLDDRISAHPAGGRKRKNDDTYSRYQRHRNEKLSASAKPRKVLSSLDGHSKDTAVTAEPEDYGDIDDDANAIEFSFRHDADELHTRTERYHSTKLSQTQLAVLKMIICSGLYPNMAIADPGNVSRRITEHVYHTRQKRFAVLHPTSVFAANADLHEKKKGIDVTSGNRFLDAAVDGDVDITNEEDLATTIKRADGSAVSVAPKISGLSSASPEFLCYMQLMETTKPYLINLLRVPALQTSLLFGRSIDTNPNCSMMVVDDWILVDFKNASRFVGKGYAKDGELAVESRAGQRVLAMAMELRHAWARLVARKLMRQPAYPKFAERFPDGILGLDRLSDIPQSTMATVPQGIQTVLHHLCDANEQDLSMYELSLFV